MHSLLIGDGIKAEVQLMDLCQPGEFSEDLFVARPAISCDRFIQMNGTTNGCLSTGTVRSASVPLVPTGVYAGR